MSLTARQGVAATNEAVVDRGVVHLLDGTVDDLLRAEVHKPCGEMAADAGGRESERAREKARAKARERERRKEVVRCASA